MEVLKLEETAHNPDDKRTRCINGCALSSRSNLGSCDTTYVEESDGSHHADTEPDNRMVVSHLPEGVR